MVRNEVHAFQAMYLRFNPQAWSGSRIAMRVEAYGCSTRKETKRFFLPQFPTCFFLFFFLMSSFKILIRPPESDPNTIIDKFIKDFKNQSSQFGLFR